MSAALTKSEAIFEDFLRHYGLPFERIPEANNPRPDYRVTAGTVRLMVEVKELLKDDDFSKEPFVVSSRTVGDHIRSKIREASKQVRFGADQGIPSILLIYNALDPLHLFGTENHDFLDAMYGERTLLLNLESGNVVSDFHGRNRLFSEDRNRGKTHFSALGRLAPRNGRMTITLFENCFSCVPIPYDALPPCFEVIHCKPEKAL